MDPDLASLVLAPPKSVQPTIPVTEGTKEKKADVDILQILKTQGKADAEGKKPKKQAPEQPKKKRKRGANVELQPYNVSQAKRKPKKKKQKKEEEDAPVTAASMPQPKTLLECMQQSAPPPPPAQAPLPPPPPPPPAGGGTTVKEVITKIYFDLDKEIKRQNARKEKLEKRKEDPKIDQDELMDKLIMTDVLLRMHKEQQDVVIKYFPHCYMQF